MSAETPLCTIIWRARANSDLLGIIRYIGKDNPLRAESFAKEMKEKSKPLEQHPLLGRAGRLPGTRELVVHPNYLLIYRQIDKAGSPAVEILRIKHSAQQLP
jgi:toxin ParE1/3/4